MPILIRCIYALILGLTMVSCGDDQGRYTDATYVAARGTVEANQGTRTSVTNLTPTEEVVIVPTDEAGPILPQTPMSNSTPESTPTAATPAPPTPASIIAPIVISGSGAETTEPLTLPSRLTIITSRSTGSGLFRVSAHDIATGTGKVVALGSSPCLGSLAIVPHDAVEITTAATGNWEIKLSFPSTSEFPVYYPPYQTNGTGNQAVYFLQIWPGSYTISTVHDGDGSFSVTLVDLDAYTTQQLIEAEGASQRSARVTTTVEPYGLYAINVQADGNWTLKIK